MRKKNLFLAKKSFIFTFEDVFLMKTRDKEVKSEENRCAIDVIYNFQKRKTTGLIQLSRGVSLLLLSKMETSAALISPSRVKLCLRFIN